MANSELSDWSDEMVTATFEAVSLACRLALDPTVTFPKLRGAGVTPSSGYTPVASTSIVSRGFLAVLRSVMTPVVCPLAVGLKITGNSRVGPGLIVTGTGNLPNEKAFPCIDLEVIRSVLLPVFESWME